MLWIGSELFSPCWVITVVIEQGYICIIPLQNHSHTRNELEGRGRGAGKCLRAVL